MGHKKGSSFFAFESFRTELLVIALAVYFSTFLNTALWNELLQTQSGVGPTQRWLFMWTAMVGITAFQVILISLVCWGRHAKWMAGVFVMIAAIAHYFSLHYKVYFNKSMLQNVLATNFNEASELLTMQFAAEIALTTVPVFAVLYFFNTTSGSFRRQLAAKAIVVSVASVVVIAGLFAQFKTLSSAMRNHREVRHLIVPASPTFSLIRAVGSDASDVVQTKVSLDNEAVRVDTPNVKPLLTVVVVGETVRAQNWSLSGYGRQTTPQLTTLPPDELFNVPFLRSCGTNTEVSVPCLFSGIGRGDYDQQFIKSHYSILHLLKQTGVDVTWIDNQSGCKGACDGIRSVALKDLIPQKATAENLPDEYLVEATNKLLSPRPINQVIVLHMLGNHGPAYAKRYPPSYEFFKPACQDSNLANCSADTIRNAYDNAIRYTDGILAALLQRLARVTDRDVTMMYVSDHGESLGESGVYLHGLPYAIAPDEQTKVPFVLWLPSRTQSDLHIKAGCVRESLRSAQEHDVIAHTVLGLYSVRSSVYKPRFDLLKGCRA